MDSEIKEFGNAAFVKSIDQDKKQIVAVASTGNLDRDNEIVLPSAFKELLPVYMKNPVVLSAHSHRLQSGNSPVVAVVLSARANKDGLHVVIEFETETELGKEYWTLYSRRRQRAFSIGFIPIEWEFKKVNGREVKVFTKVELLEISCVPVPSNREALSRSKQRKLDFVQRMRTARQNLTAKDIYETP